MIILRKFQRKLKIPALAVVFSLLIPISASANIADDIAARQRQIDEIQKQIEQYQAQADVVGQQSKTLQSEIAKMNAQIGQLTAQIRSLSVSIDQTDLQIQQASFEISESERKIGLHRQALAEYIREMDKADQYSLTQILLQHKELSEFFSYLHNIQRTQDNLRLTIRSIAEIQIQLDQRRDELKGRQTDLEKLKDLQQLQQSSLAGAKGAKDKILKETKGEESKYQQLIKQSQQDLARLQQEISYLLQGGLTVEDAVKYANLAAIGAGIRPAFLLALLEIESRLGRNVGSGNWQDDMYLCYQRLAQYYPSKKDYYLKRAETEKNAFLVITSKLGLDPNSVKVSKEPTYGCGGAMGPAQFIPSTWLGYEDEVVRITGRAPANPWNFEDAFTASALKLARGGATSKDRAGESRAARAYISGNPSCVTSTCNSYTNAILQKAAQIEQDL